MPRLTDATARTHQGNGNDHCIWDDQLSGFGLRLTKAGAKRWLVAFRARGKARRMSLGDPAIVTAVQARARAKEILAEAALGRDPWADHQAAKKTEAEASDTPTFADLLPEWMKDRIAKGKWSAVTQDTVERLIRRVLIPAFGNTRVDELTRQEIKAYHREKSDSPAMANRIVDWLEAFYAWCIDEEIVQSSPCVRIERYPEKARTRVASEHEMRKLWAAFGTAPAPWDSYFRLLYLLGVRQSDLWALRWSDVHPSGILLPTTKNGEPREVVPGGPARAELERLRERYGSTEWVFGERLSRSVMYHEWSAVKVRAKLEEAGITIHDLRRTKGSRARSRGVPLGAVSKMLGHKMQSTTDRVYAHLADDVVREAEESTQAALLAEVEGDLAEVVPLRR